MYIQFIHAYADTVMGGTYVSICKVCISIKNTCIYIKQYIRRRLCAVSAPSPRGRYGKFVARQRKRRQIATS